MVYLVFRLFHEHAVWIAVEGHGLASREDGGIPNCYFKFFLQCSVHIVAYDNLKGAMK